MIRFFKVDMREPYMGNTVVVGAIVEVHYEKLGKPVVSVTMANMTESIKEKMKPIPPEEFFELFND